MNKFLYILFLITFSVFSIQCSQLGFDKSLYNSSYDTGDGSGDGSGGGSDGGGDGTNPGSTPSAYSTITEKFTGQVTEKKVDILFVTDNSGSMYEDQLNLSTKLTSFISKIQDVDWQIAVTTTDSTDGSSTYLGGSIVNFTGSTLKVINKSTTNAETLFENTVMREEDGTIDEQPLLSIKLAMGKRYSANSGFFRDGADLVTVIVSDEDELSTGPVEATQPQSVIDAFKNIWGSTKKLRGYGIIVQPGDTACLAAQQLQGRRPGSTATGPATVNYGNLLQEFADLTGGLTGSICESDFSTTLSEIGKNVGELYHSYDLKYEPISADQVTVTMVPSQNIQWSLSGKRIVFSEPIPVGTTVTIVYVKK